MQWGRTKHIRYQTNNKEESEKNNALQTCISTLCIKYKKTFIHIINIIKKVNSEKKCIMQSVSDIHREFLAYMYSVVDVE